MVYSTEAFCGVHFALLFKKKLALYYLFITFLHGLEIEGHSFSPNSYNGKTVKGVLGSSVNFTWTFSGSFTRVDWGLAVNSKNFHSIPQLLVSLLKTGQLQVTPPVAYLGRVSGKLTGSQLTFTLMNISKGDGRLYGCKVSDTRDPDDIPSFDSVNFEVESPPVITDISPNTTVNEGETVTLTCTAGGKPPANITWTKDNKVVDFPLNNIRREDAGLYQCTADNGVDYPATANAFITVQYPAVIQSLTSSVSKSCIGHTVTFNCKSDGVPIPSLTLYNPEGTEFNLVKAKESTVVFAMNSSADFGLYNCTAENKIGLASKTVYLRRIGIPAAALIKDLPVETKDEKVKLMWDEPQNNGAPILKYTVYQRIVNNGSAPQEWAKIHVFTDVSVHEVYVVDLEMGGDYEFAVTSSNTCGESLKEEEKMKRISVLGDVPNVVKVTDGVILKWKEPESNGAAIIEYSVYQRFVNDDEWRKIASITDVYKRSYVVEIEKGKEYEFVVTATNKYGESSKKADIKRIKVVDVSTKPPKNQEDSAESNKEGVLHGVYISVILLFSIVIGVLIVVLWKMHLRFGLLHSNRKQEFQKVEESVALKTMEPAEETEQPSRAAQQDEAVNYEAPGGADYMPLHPSKRSWEISREHVKIIKVIGKGAFSEVAKAMMRHIQGNQDYVTVAAKMLKANAPDSDRKDLLSELELMKKLKPHPHVIKLMGCVTESDPLLVLIEYVPFGDLLGYLRKSRGLNDTYFKDPDVKPQTSLTAEQLMKFAWQVADGMCYLSSKKTIHRDLAARNVLVGEGEKCKVTDFGMARNVQQEDMYTKKSRGRLPVKWTAYEALLYGIYTTQSDVWSYGILLYEILTVGGSPYPDIKPRQIAHRLQEGYRMPKPKHVDGKVYQLMMKCWEEQPIERPTFENLRRTMKEMERKHKAYVNLREYDSSLYANINDLAEE